MMESAAQALFAFYAIVIVLGALGAVRAANLVRALLGLILALFGVSGMYLLMDAPLLALMQLLIYVGAVVVLVFFAIMLTRAPAGGEEAAPKSIRSHLLALLAAATPGFLLAWSVITRPAPSLETPASVSPAELGQGLLEHYILAFELISVVLFVAMSGAVILAFRGFARRGDDA